MDKSNGSYEDMSKGKRVNEQSEVETDRVPYENSYEKSIGGSDGLNQSGTKG
jgi:hypothetical protein